MRDLDGAAEGHRGLDPIEEAYLAEALAPHGVGVEALAPAALARLLADVQEFKSATAWPLIHAALSSDDAPERIGRDLWRAQNGDATAFQWLGANGARFRDEARVIGPREIFLAVDGQHWCN